MNVQQAITQFLEHGQTVRNLSDRTVRAYQSDLAQFHLHMNDVSTAEITPQHLETYLDKLGDGPYRDTSIARERICDDMSATSGTSPVCGVHWYSTPPIVSLVQTCTYAASGSSFHVDCGGT